ncbi:mannose-6-phosphate isomerase, class I [Specibacter cremeus]|uniref:mannose-6-phosphate isomerase, class I n=1 Tax=Specibacter cremeus TaxID=1629051 RepID=UPI000F779C94|nr:mannose-6-phosphate isomerase, class I [Specibacter cremeus]
MYALTNPVRPYAWGSATAIAGLLGREPGGGPEAELWLGAHPDAPSMAATPDGPMPLDALIAAHPRSLLGAAVQEQFGRLPFLAKLLAADSALSLQVHPTLEWARARFAAEEAAGVPLDAPHRNYRDDNHKPEMLYALTDFEALCGFRPCGESADLFRAVAAAIEAAGSPVPELLDRVIATLNSRMGEPAVLRRAFELLLTGGDTAAALVDLAAASLALPGPAPADALAPALRTVVDLQARHPGDPGVLVTLLLNRVSLHPGQAIYLPAGNVHAYLHGLAVEVMASSDNVLRGGLTAKHVDVPELLATVDFSPTPVPYLDARTTDLGQDVWEPPFREFALQRVELAPGDEPVPLAQNGPLVVLAVSGAALLDSPKSELRLARGESAFVGAGEEPVLAHPAHDAGTTVLFAVTCAAAVRA